MYSTHHILFTLQSVAMDIIGRYYRQNYNKGQRYLFRIGKLVCPPHVYPSGIVVATYLGRMETVSQDNVHRVYYNACLIFIDAHFDQNGAMIEAYEIKRQFDKYVAYYNSLSSIVGTDGLVIGKITGKVVHPTITHEVYLAFATYKGKLSHLFGISDIKKLRTLVNPF